MNSDPQPPSEEAERVFRQGNEAALVTYICLAVASLAATSLNPYSWLGHAGMALFPWVALKLCQSLYARRYAIGVSLTGIRLVSPGPSAQSFRGDSVLSVFVVKSPGLQLSLCLTLLGAGACLALYLFPRGTVPSWLVRAAIACLFFLPFYLTIPIHGRLMSLGLRYYSAPVALAGLAGALWRWMSNRSILAGVEALVATMVVLLSLHWLRLLWARLRGSVRSLGGVAKPELPMELCPQFLWKQALSGTPLFGVWSRDDGALVIHPFRPKFDEAEAFANAIRHLWQWPQHSQTPESCLTQAQDSVADAQRGDLSGAISKCQDSLDICEASGFVFVSILVSEILIEHLISAGRGLEAAQLADRYYRTAKDAGYWFMPSNLRTALAVIRASYGEFARALVLVNKAQGDAPCWWRFGDFDNNRGMCRLMQAGLLRQQQKLPAADRRAARAAHWFHRVRGWMSLWRWLSFDHQITWETALANEAEAIQIQGEIAVASGDRATAAKSFGDSAALYERFLKHSSTHGTAGGDQLSGAAAALEAAGRTRKADEIFSAAVRLADSQPGDVYHRFISHKRFGDSLFRRAAFDRAHEHYTQAMSALELCPVMQTESLTRYYGGWQRHELFASAIKAAIKLDRADLALVDAERSRQEGFRQIVRGAIHPNGRLDPEAEQQVDEELRNTRSPSGGGNPGAQGTAGGPPPGVPKAGKGYFFDVVASRIVEQPPDCAGIAAAVPPNSALVAYQLVDNNLFAFCIRGGSSTATMVPLNVVPEQIQNLLGRVFFTVGDKELGRKLFKLLFPEHLLELIEGARRLYVAPTQPLVGSRVEGGGLTGVPFAALIDTRNRYLIQENGLFPDGIAYLPCCAPIHDEHSSPATETRPDLVFGFGGGFVRVKPSPDCNVVVTATQRVSQIVESMSGARLVCFHHHGCPNANILWCGMTIDQWVTGKSVLRGLHFLSFPTNGRARAALTPCSTASLQVNDPNLHGGEEMLGFVLPLLQHSDVVIGSLWDADKEQYECLADSLRSVTGSLDAIQETALWQRKQIAQRKHAANWAWPLVWTRLRGAARPPAPKRAEQQASKSSARITKQHEPDPRASVENRRRKVKLIQDLARERVRRRGEGTTEIRRQLVDFLKADPDPQVRIAAAEAIASYPGTYNVIHLTGAIERDEDPEVRDTCLRLVRFNCPENDIGEAIGKLNVIAGNCGDVRLRAEIEEAVRYLRSLRR